MTVLLQIVQVRGYDLTIPRWWQVSKWPGYLWRVCACIPVITIPLLIGSLRTTSVMAMVVDARAFGSHSKRNSLHTHFFSAADYITVTALICLTLAVALLVLLHIGNRQV